MGSIYLGADIGTTSAKCLAVDENGTILALSQHPYGMSHPRQGWAEQDPEDYWRGFSEVVRRCIGQLEGSGRASRDVAALALSTQGDTLIVADDAGTPVRPAISWMDSRGADQCRQMLARTGQEFWYAETGIRLTPYSSACAIRWLRENESETLREGRVCWVADFMARRLCGRYACDTPSASWTSVYSPYRRDWSAPVLDIVGVEPDVLPAVQESGDAIGEILPGTAAELGLGDGVRLAAGAFDQAAAAHGASAAPEGRSVLSCGTAWVLYAVSGQPVSDPNLGIPVCCHVRPDEWGLVLPFTGGSAYDWARRIFPGDGEVAEGSPNEPLIFIPHLYGGLCPDWREESRGTIVGLTLSHTAADIEMAVMRGLGFEARRNLEAAGEIAPRPGRVRMVGGATRSSSWPQLIADVLAIPVEVWDCAESACYGAARLAAGALSAGWEGGDIRTIDPRAERVEAESALYEKYLGAYEKALAFYSA